MIVLASSRVVPKWWDLGDSLTSSGSENPVTCGTVQVPEVALPTRERLCFSVSYDVHVKWVFETLRVLFIFIFFLTFSW